MKPKLLFLIESLSGGGAEKVLSVLLKHIDKTKFDITLCTIVDTGIYAAEVRKYVNYTSVLGNPQKKVCWVKYYIRFCICSYIEFYLLS